MIKYESILKDDNFSFAKDSSKHSNITIGSFAATSFIEKSYTITDKNFSLRLFDLINSFYEIVGIHIDCTTEYESPKELKESVGFTLNINDLLLINTSCFSCLNIKDNNIHDLEISSIDLPKGRKATLKVIIYQK